MGTTTHQTHHVVEIYEIAQKQGLIPNNSRIFTNPKIISNYTLETYEWCQYGRHKFLENNSIQVPQHHFKQSLQDGKELEATTTTGCLTFCQCSSCPTMAIKELQLCPSVHHHAGKEPCYCYRESNHQGSCVCKFCDIQVASFMDNKEHDILVQLEWGIRRDMAALKASFC
ncbi:hypothetical protein AKO1_008697, partial [Acrasis kona]